MHIWPLIGASTCPEKEPISFSKCRSRSVNVKKLDLKILKEPLSPLNVGYDHTRISEAYHTMPLHSPTQVSWMIKIQSANSLPLQHKLKILLSINSDHKHNSEAHILLMRCQQSHVLWDTTQSHANTACVYELYYVIQQKFFKSTYKEILKFSYYPSAKYWEFNNFKKIYKRINFRLKVKNLTIDLESSKVFGKKKENI